MASTGELVAPRVVLPARLGALLLGLALAAGPAEALNFVVNSTLDTADAGLNGVCDVGGGVCTLRAAIMESNFGGAANLITFNLGAGPYSIAVGAAGLPAITRAVTIDGYSQAGSSANTLPAGSNAVLLIELNGAATAAGVNGLTISALTTVRGLVINRFAGHGIQVSVGGATSVIAGNYVGTNAAGSAALGNNRDTVGSEAGIELFGGGVTIGGTAPADRNLVSGNSAGGARGIELWDSSGNTIQGNYVGTNATGTLPLGNGGAGIALDGTAGVGSDNNLIGGAVAGAGNLCSGGLAEGIAVYTSSTGNAIVGNRIYGNGTMGIDLGGDGVTGNDLLDGDGGPNNQLNFPVIGAVSVVGASLVVSFSLDVPAGSYRVEFFRNPSGVDIPNGEGEVFAGFQNVTHGGGGSQSFSATITGVSGDRITATTTLCTDGGVCAAFSDTSEFSANLIATPTNYRSIGTAPDDSTGSVNTTNNSQIVAGIGTSWRAINRGRGDVISICDQVFPTCTTSTNYTVLAVGSNTQLTLTTPYTGSTGSHGYTIRRQFATLIAWQACIDGQGGSPPPAAPCFYFPAPTASLVADNRSEVGIAYNDVVGADFAGGLAIDNSVTDASHTITLTADGGNRHYGLPGQGVLINNGASVAPAVQVYDDFVTVEWMEITGGGGTADGIRVNLLSAGAGSLVTLRNNLVHNVTGDGIALYDPDGRVDIYNNISYGNVSGLWINPGTLLAGSRFRILNNTVYGNAGGIFKAAGASAATVLLRNNISVFNNPAADYGCDPLDSVDPASSNNLDEDNSGGTGAGTHNPAGGRVTSTVAAVAFVNAGAGDLHIQPASSARDVAADLSSVFTRDIDASLRQSPWDIGADDVTAQTNYRSIGTAPDDSTGSVSTTNGSAIVGGVGTSWLAINRGRGDVISICDQAFPTCTSSTNYTVLGVGSNTQLTLTTPYAGSTGSHGYTIRRQFRGAGNAGQALVDWENCIDGGPCTYFGAGITSSLVADNRREVGIAYKDSVFGLAADFNIQGSTTDATHTIRLTADGVNRHNGAVGTGVVVDAQLGPNEVIVRDANVTIEWLELRGLRAADNQGQIRVLDSGATNVLLQNLLIHDFYEPAATINQGGIRLSGVAGKGVTVRNVMIWDGDREGISADALGDTLTIENCSIDDLRDSAGSARRGVFANATTGVIVRNTIVTRSGTDFVPGTGSFAAGPTSTNNISSDATAPGNNPLTALAANLFVNPGIDLHLKAGAVAIDSGVSLAPSFYNDIDGALRPAGAQWDRGADEFGATTAVKLQSFAAEPGDGSVTLEWRTGSELDNLGFHVYRGVSGGGPWTRLNASLIPGLGSSAVGQGYAFRDVGLQNGTRYFYRLEDVDAASKSTFHGPVSAVPQASDGAPDAGGEEGTSGKKKDASSASCPDWVVAAYGSSSGASAASLSCTRHGDPEAVSLRIVSHDARAATLELKTGGFYALHEASGTVRVFVPGFDFPQDAEDAALPFRRALVDAVVGRRVQLAGVRAWDQVGFRGLVPSALGAAEMQVSEDGTILEGRRALRATRRAVRELGPRRSAQTDLARLLPSVFQGETKSAVVLISPLRFDARRQQLLLAKRVLVRLLFTGRETGESGRGRIGRRERPQKPISGELLARLYTTSLGLHAVAFEQVFPGRNRGYVASELRLERQGEAVGFHLEPSAASFGPGSVLYFHSDRATASTDFSSEVAYELVRSRSGGPSMPLVSAAPAGDAVTSASLAQASFETNRFYQPGLLEAPDLWLWEALASGTTRVKAFSLAGVNGASSQPAELEVFLQGASESGNPVDHHVSVSLNGALLGEVQFAGKQPYRMSLSVPLSLLREGENELSLTNVGDTGVSSFVFLDRFMLAHPQASWLAGGRFEGTWPESGSVSLSGVSGAAVVVDVTAAGAPRWLSGYSASGGSLRFQAEAGQRYLAVSSEGLLAPRVASPEPLTLRANTNQADYVLVAPRAFLSAAEPLLQRRQDQGLRARAVAFEEIANEFGHGQPSAEAIQSFLAYAFQSWARPSPRYVLLLGDASYDPRNFMGTSQPSPLPALWTKTSYLWTVSDPLLAAVNGEDELPDLAIGRIPATTLEQAQRLVAKLLAWEESGQGLNGTAVLVADNPDLAGDFEFNVKEIAESYLVGRSELLLLSELGAQTRPRILDALNAGLSYLDYVGHGGGAVWASENVWNSWDAPSLLAQSQQPLLVTMNCLNGYFVAPSYDSLSESLLKAEGRGAIAAFSPSGLSLDGPAHQYHRALMAELTSGRHERLGDAVVAAQKAYAQTGLMPELLSIYHLLGDPAMSIR